MIEEEAKKDKFWLYVGLTTLALVTTLVLVKMNEDEKFAPIKQQLQEEEAQMNIRVLN
jgi:cytochrome c-type biogenesis protein CcmE